MRYVYYGRDNYSNRLYHGSAWDNHKYIDKIKIGDAWRYFYNQAELAAFNAGKNIKGAVDAAGKAVNDAGRTINNEYRKARGQVKAAIGNQIYKDQVSARNPKNINKSLGDYARYQDSNPINQIKSTAYRTAFKAQKAIDNIGKTMTKGLASFDKGLKDLGKSIFNAYCVGRGQVKAAIGNQIYKDQVSARNPKNINKSLGDYARYEESKPLNQLKSTAYRTGHKIQKGAKETVDAVGKALNGLGGTRGKNANMHSRNQGIAGMTGRNNSPKNNQGIAGMTGKGNRNIHGNNQGIAGRYDPNSLEYTNPGKKKTKMDARAEKAYLKDQIDSSMAKYNKAAGEKNKARLTNERAEKSYAKDQIDSSMAKFKRAADKKNQSRAKQQKSIENSYYQSYIKDGHTPEQARRWAKQAAENYMKKHG